METSEGKQKRLVKKYLAERGAYCYMPVKHIKFGQKTIDMLVCLDGLFVGIETKAPFQEPTPLQHQHMQNIRHAGGIAIWGTAEVIIRELETLIPRRRDEQPGVFGPKSAPAGADAQPARERPRIRPSGNCRPRQPSQHSGSKLAQLFGPRPHR